MNAERELVVVWEPACMDPAEWADWQRLNPVLNSLMHTERPCTDCPIGYARQMRAIGRCNGTPALVVEENPVIDSDDLTTIDVVSEAPCPGCAHRNVCSMRAGVEGLRSIEAVLPKLPRAIKTVVSVQVECSEFLRDRTQGRDPSTAGARASAAARASWTPEKRAAASIRLAERRARGEMTGHRPKLDTSPEAREARSDAFVAAAEELVEA